MPLSPRDLGAGATRALCARRTRGRQHAALLLCCTAALPLLRSRDGEPPLPLIEALLTKSARSSAGIRRLPWPASSSAPGCRLPRPSPSARLLARTNAPGVSTPGIHRVCCTLRRRRGSQGGKRATQGRAAASKRGPPACLQQGGATARLPVSRFVFGLAAAAHMRSFASGSSSSFPAPRTRRIGARGRVQRRSPPLACDLGRGGATSRAPPHI